MTHDEKIRVLRQQGVTLPDPGQVSVSDDVPLDRVQGPNTTLYPGARLVGSRLLVCSGARIAASGPAVVQDCAVGPGVTLGSGTFSSAVFLRGASMGPCAQVRAGTLLEEEASGAHTVGLKQTILLPFVTLGSLINFCDILMAGGTSRRDHSEVGSSFIHFNFTPFGESGDKATPSLIGEVPRGVMLRSNRIFLGGQGGLVGPLSMDYGTVLAAGFVYRRDHGPDELVVGEKLTPRTLPWTPHRYVNIRAKVERNLRYVGNLVALWHWYDRVRLRVAGTDRERAELYRRGRDMVASGIAERVGRLGQIAGYMERSVGELERSGHLSAEVHVQKVFAAGWAGLERELLRFPSMESPGAKQRTRFLAGLDRALEGASGGYVATVRRLDDDTVKAGTGWLTALVEHTVGLMRWEQT